MADKEGPERKCEGERERGGSLWSVYVARVIPFIPYTILLLLLPPGSLLFPAFPSRNMPRYHKFPFSSSSTLTGTIFLFLIPQNLLLTFRIALCMCPKWKEKERERKKARHRDSLWLVSLLLIFLFTLRFGSICSLAYTVLIFCVPFSLTPLELHASSWMGFFPLGNHIKWNNKLR